MKLSTDLNNALLTNCPDNLAINTNVSGGNVDHQQADLTINANNTIASGAEAIYHAGDEVLLSVGFDALNGSVFRAYIEGCTDNYQVKSEPDSNDTIVKEEIRAPIDASQALKIYPNPSSAIFNLAIKGSILEDFEVAVYNITGSRIYSKSYKNENFKSLQIDIREFPLGMYFVKLQNGSELYTGKMIKKK